MKNLFLILTLTICFDCFSQETEKTEIAAVEVVVNRFFESLEKQDTVLLKEVAFMEGQIWTVNNTVSPARHRMRYFKDDLKTFQSKNTFQEEAYKIDVQIHEGIAMAWGPYEFRLNGAFSHCGVDVFTLVKNEGNWKIINLSYTIDKEGCEELKSKK
ncbi:putative lumazine-binding protein [Algoriphagus ratkowskyi]|uniref:Nuclear transport factor 2 family protein n=1 Tax=Algoriphagus ratkowskyi TaxID=57028 RepID=A0A2W7S1E2_9BACT|nr:nuclear transport factor 2 family protein [Algoriphagus ratkowskyi]PZX61187.1 putative lumazine-binding protein [Algoriphagus ratkowskyi]TXD79308.1 nuclear transport factor 2 family protein [Algoriphagus ratkowskyi]